MQSGRLGAVGTDALTLAGSETGHMLLLGRQGGGLSPAAHSTLTGGVDS